MNTHDQSVSTLEPDGGPALITAAPGSFYLAQIPGWVGRGVSAAQALTRGGCLWTHAGIYIGDGQIVQAEPGGARVRNFDDCYRGREVLWSDAPIERSIAGLGMRGMGMDDAPLRQLVVDAALALVDTPYSWLDYAVIAAAEWRWPGWERLVDLTEQRGHLICSSLVDRAYSLAGIHLFADRRPLGQVTPADLARLDETWMRYRLSDLESRVAAIEGKLP